MRITTKGQVTIPREVREQAGFPPGTDVEFFIGDDGVVRVVKADDKDREARLRSFITSFRGSADAGISTDEIMAMTRE